MHVVKPFTCIIIQDNNLYLFVINVYVFKSFQKYFLGNGIILFVIFVYANSIKISVIELNGYEMKLLYVRGYYPDDLKR